MNKQSIQLLACYIAVALTSSQACAATKYYDHSQETTTTLREVRDGLDDLKHEVNNHEKEIRTFEESLSNQALTMDSLRQQILDATQANKELIRLSTGVNESKVEGIDATAKSLVTDVKQLKTHANESSAALEQYQQRIAKLEKIIEIQNKNIANLENALTSLASALEVKESLPITKISTDEGYKIYVVKSGDSLEKIAKNQGTTIKALRELNQISSDKIVIGQKIKIP